MGAYSSLPETHSGQDAWGVPMHAVAEIMQGIDLHDANEWWCALWMTICTKRAEDCDDRLFRRLWLKWMLVLALLLRRTWRDNGSDDYYCYFDMGYWNSTTHYGGWSASMVWLYPKRLRYSLQTDGETNL